MINKTRANGIDFLRGISICIVVLYHYTYHYDPAYLYKSTQNINFFKYGWLGVDIFFLVSGFCIAMTIENSKNIYFFLTRRFSRLYPAYVFCGIITIIFYYFFSLPDREVDIISGLQNIFLLNIIPGYKVTYIDGIYWALVVEVKFYLFFGIAYYFISDKKKLIVYLFLICFIGSIFKIFFETGNNFFLSIFPHINIFFFGICLYNLKKISNLLKVAILIFVLFSIFIFKRYDGIELELIIFLFISSFILIKNKIFKNTLFEKIGLYSYSWYLIHNAIGLIIIREINQTEFYKFSLYVAVIATLVLSCIIFYMVEKPGKRLLIKFSNFIYSKLIFR